MVSFFSPDKDTNIHYIMPVLQAGTVITDRQCLGTHANGGLVKNCLITMQWGKNQTRSCLTYWICIFILVHHMQTEASQNRRDNDDLWVTRIWPRAPYMSVWQTTKTIVQHRRLFKGYISNFLCRSWAQTKRDKIHLDPVKPDSLHRAQICQEGRITRLQVWVLQWGGACRQPFSWLLTLRG